MRRREFITLLGGVAAWPLVARAQQPGRQLGYLVLIYRWAAAQRAPIVDLARELLELNVTP